MELTGPDAQEKDTDASTSIPSILIGGLRIDTLPLDRAVKVLLGAKRPKTVHLCNAYTVSVASKDDRYRAALNDGELNLADGMPVVWVARRRGHAHLTRRASGPDLMERCIDQGQVTSARHYLYGSTPEVLASLQHRIAERWPDALVVGVESPPFRELSDDEIREAAGRAAAVRADFVWVGLGTPKQDYEIERLSRDSDATFIAIGAAFDFIAGSKKRAPVWMQRYGLEWMFRLLSEPRRLWKRYLIGNARFVALLIRGRE